MQPTPPAKFLCPCSPYFVDLSLRDFDGSESEEGLGDKEMVNDDNFDQAEKHSNSGENICVDCDGQVVQGELLMCKGPACDERVCYSCSYV